jgi:hypothetical protein
MASWFVYEHTENHNKAYDDRNWHCGQLVLNGACFRKWDDLVTIGLAGSRPPLTEGLRVGRNLTEEECSQWAWATIQGYIPADYHNVWNYDWYAHRVLDNRGNSVAVPGREVLALRIEHLADDWASIDKYLGGTGEVPPSLLKKENAATDKHLRVLNQTMSPNGIQNLCRALCDEIQVYKRLLLNAVNLNSHDLQESQLQLRQYCPEETSIVPRECDYS